MANSAVVGILRAILTMDTAEFQSASKRAANEAKALTKDLNQIGRQASNVGAALTKTLTLPILGLGVASAKAAIDFQSSFANVGKTVDGVSDKTGKLTVAGEALAMSFRDLAKDIPATTDELNAIAALGGQMGVPIDQLETFTRHVAALGVAVDGISTEDAAAGLAQIGNISGKGTTQIAQMASALVHLGNSSNATEADILEFTKRLMGAGNAVGMTVAEVMALGTAMADVGINAEAGGTAMSIVITKISTAVSKGGEALESFARIADRSAEEFAAKWRESPIQAIDLFVKGLARTKASGADLNLTMGELGTEGIRVADTLKRLSGNAEGVSKNLGIANEGFAAGNKHLEEAHKKYGTVANQMAVLWNRIKDIGITIGAALIPTMESLIGLANRLLPAVAFLADGFAKLPGIFQLGIIGLAGVAAAIGPVLWGAGQLTLALGAVTGAFTANGIATRALAGAHGILAGTTTGLTAGFVRLAASLTAYTAAFAAGAMVAHLHESRLKSMAESGADLAKATKDVADKEAELERARARGNDKLEFRLSAELKALQAAKDTARAVAEKARNDQYAADRAKQYGTAVAGAAETTDDFTLSTGKATKATKELADQMERDFIAVWTRLTAPMTAGMDWQDQWREALQKGPGPRDLGWEDEWNAVMAPMLRQHEAMRVQMETPIHWNFETAEYEAFIRSMNEASRKSDDVKGSWLSALDQVSGGFQMLSQVADGVMSAIVRGIGTAMTSVRNMASGFTQMLEGGFANILSGGMGIVGGAIQIGQLIANAFRGEGARTNDDRDAWMEQMGGFRHLQEEIGRFGNDPILMSTFQRLYNTASQDEFRRASEAFTERLTELTQQSERDIAALNTEFDRLGGELSALGPRAPAAFQPLIAELLTSDRLTGNLRSTLEGLAGGSSVADLEGMMTRFGISADAMGKSFHQAKIAEEADAIHVAISNLSDAGADADGVLRGMADEVQTLIDNSRKFGVDVPEYMRPTIERMMTLGLLTDDAGDKMTDLGGVTFAPIESTFDRMGDLLEDIRDLLRDGLPKAAAEGAKGVEDEFKKRDFSVRVPFIFGSPDIGAGLGVPVADTPMRPVTSSGLVWTNPGDWVGMPHLSGMDFGAGTLGQLSGQSVSPADYADYKAPRVAASGGGTMTVVLQADGRDLTRIITPYLPGEVRRYGIAKV